VHASVCRGKAARGEAALRAKARGLPRGALRARGENNKREDRDAEGKYGGQNEALLACNARPTLACKAIHRV